MEIVPNLQRDKMSKKQIEYLQKSLDIVMEILL